MSHIHSFLDRSSVPTWRYERAVRVLLEIVLLVACAAPVVTGWRSLVAQALVAALRLHQAETSREKASIISRAHEDGRVREWDLSAFKRNRIYALTKREALIAWTWPVLVPIVSAAETRALGLVAVLGIVATLARVAFDRKMMPAWRKSRVEWRKAQTEDWTRRAVSECAHAKLVPEVCDQTIGVLCLVCNTILAYCWADEHISESLWNRACENDKDASPCEQNRDDYCALCGEAIEAVKVSHSTEAT